MEGSRLGSKDYWEEAYCEEIKNLDDFGDEGEVWFGEDVLETMVEFTEDAVRSSFQDPTSASFIDIGTGNGSFLHELARLGFSNLVGSDYSPLSIELCKKLAVKKGLGDIRFVVDDVLASKIEERFEVACDKGTFDAVGLAPDGLQKRLQYITAVASCLEPDGLLIITSCNSTKDELVEEFEATQLFQYLDHVKTYPTFSFGGQEGSRVATVAFQRSKS
ncbi:hypothetical protein BSKO_06307 [Bryopsis sp. KO-2023]|nr:hypothetical protein BSKO_06307 [Bryopsis sp. KO-2023]